MSLMKDEKPLARLCHIIKWDDFDGYGFNLHAERGKNGQFIGKVDDGSPSQAAGLRQGDRIIEVNEINILNETHKQVVDRIKAFANETKLLVVDQQADEYFKTNNIIIRGTSTSYIKIIKTPEKNPASIDNEERSEGSISSMEDNMRKSVGSNDTSSNNGSTIAATTTPTSENIMSSNKITHENGSNDNNNIENGNNGAIIDENDGHSETNNGTTTSTKKGLNLMMSAKELRAKLAARKKYDPKKESLGFKDKFDIVQKL